MASAAFQLLSAGGVNFNKQKYKKDFELFGNKPPKNGAPKAEVKSAAETAILPFTLDFFGHAANAAAGPSTPQSSEKSAKKRKRQAEDPADSPSAFTITQFPAALPAPPPQKISITGPAPLPTSHTSFTTLFPAESHQRYLLSNLHKQGVQELWGVQGAVSGAILDEKRRDVLVIAPTGSGKTLAYLMPLVLKLEKPCRSTYKAEAEEILSAIKPKSKKAKPSLSAKPSSSSSQSIRSIILIPTHELALQIYAQVKHLLEGVNWRVILLEKSTEKAVETSAKEGELGIDVLVATPERLHAMVEDGRLDLKDTQYLILDEADRLIGPDFLPQVEPVLNSHKHPQAQKVMLSATMEAGPEALARTWLRDEGVRIVVGLKDAASTSVTQKLQFCGSETGKLLALRNDIAAGSLTPPALIFVQSIDRADELYKELVLDGLRVGVVHSDKSKKERERTVNEFKEGGIWMLVVTELMARGLDFKGIEVVVNYDFPQTVQSYVHRIGRAGRAGRTGRAITYFTLEDGPYLRTIANVMKSSGCPVEPWMLDLPKPSKNLKKERRRKPVERKDIASAGKNFARRDAKNKQAMIEASKKRSKKAGAGKTAGNAVEVDLSE